MIISRVIMSFLLLLLPQIASAHFDDFMKEIDKLSLPGAKTLRDDKIISGLKEALNVGTENTVKLTGNTDGFLKNEAIKISLPDKTSIHGQSSSTGWIRPSG
ncbi:MAG: DUF4197 family protein [Nitrospirales bacterium]|nr:DUF4197 family protein [Nitrospirales bacterium]MBA3966937.1 DUF4197 family protein [Nitrospirales bacterium]